MVWQLILKQSDLMNYQKFFLTSLFGAMFTVAPSGTEHVDSDKSGSRIVKEIFYSKILKKKKNFTVVLPEGYDKSGAGYPVLYLFHGRGRHERSLVDNPQSCAPLMQAKFVIVLPDGDDNWYINSPVDKASRYNDYIEELISFAEKKYRISKDRNKRGLSGWSMGGYGCTIFAETHSDRFSALAPIIGLLDYPRRGYPRGQSYSIQFKRFGKDPAGWKKYNPFTYAGNLKNMQLLIITGKKCFTRTMNRNFVARLQELKIPVTYIEAEGGHSFQLVTEALPKVVSFMNRTIADSLKSENHEKAEKNEKDAF